MKPQPASFKPKLIDLSLFHFSAYEQKYQSVDTDVDSPTVHYFSKCREVLHGLCSSRKYSLSISEGIGISWGGVGSVLKLKKFKEISSGVEVGLRKNPSHGGGMGVFSGTTHWNSNLSN